tara:strand:- start:822 stop:1223 length:402 start_codon:yes stop_codon:yes gene_type:complete
LINTVRKGYIGETEVHKDLLKKGWNIYEPVVDDHGIDLIAEKGGTIHKLQIKARGYSKYQSRRPSLEVRVRKKSNANILAIPIKLHRCVCYMPVDFTGDMPVAGYFVSIAIKPAKNNMKMGRRWYADYMDLPE